MDKLVIFLVSFSDAITSLSYFFIPGALFCVVLMRKVRLPPPCPTITAF
jgi:hypothetical protein